MKNLLRLTYLGLAIVGLNANASYNIKSVELIDSTIIDGSEVSAFSVNNNDSTLESIETYDGQIIQASEVKKVLITKPLNNKLEVQAARMKVGGEGSGG